MDGCFTMIRSLNFSTVITFVHMTHYKAESSLASPHIVKRGTLRWCGTKGLACVTSGTFRVGGVFSSSSGSVMEIIEKQNPQHKLSNFKRNMVSKNKYKLNYKLAPNIVVRTH